jgi:hypothetical protein
MYFSMKICHSDSWLVAKFGVDKDVVFAYYKSLPLAVTLRTRASHLVVCSVFPCFRVSSFGGIPRYLQS